MAKSLEFFKNQKTYTLLNPRMELKLQEKIFKATAIVALEDHFWLASSGTENFRADAIKMIALSKEALRCAALSVCATQKITAQDVYLNTLPYFHVSGLSTLARAEVSGCKHISIEALNEDAVGSVVQGPHGDSGVAFNKDFTKESIAEDVAKASERASLRSSTAVAKWNAPYFAQKLREHHVSITSLVPTQIFDLVVAQIPAPECLRFVYVGGGAVSHSLQLKAESLGWKLVHTYGMTETAAMMAYGSRSSSYEVFPHIQDIRSTESGQLEILSPALLTGYLFISLTQEHSEFKDPKQDGWFSSGDQVRILGRTLQVLGRDSELVKIKGESVSLLKINARLQDVRAQLEIPHNAVVIALPEERDGFKLLLVVEKSFDPQMMEALNKALLPFERLQECRVIDHIPMTSLNKVQLAALKEQLGY